MKFKLHPENLLEWIGARLNLIPKPLVDTQVAFNAARAIMAAAELGVYEAIGRGPGDAGEIAAACGTHPRATAQLLDCLVSLGYLRWRGGRYALAPRYRKWLLKESPSNLTGKLRFQRYEWDWMAGLEDYVRTGRHLELHTEATPAEAWTLYMEGMRDLSVNVAKELAGKIPAPPGATALLDIGGSHGLFSIELCRKYPGLSSTVLELPAAYGAAAAIAKRYDDTGRVAYRAGDALADDLGPEKFDIVMINNVVHHFGAEQARALAAKLARALKPRGIYAIGEFIRPEKPREGDVAAGTAGLYFSLTSASGTWSEGEMREWQESAGLEPEKPIAPMGLPGWKMLIARKGRAVPA
jgi:2-polyprenyl-3-methyl-5-hydroxy-6-metoxy-1,4-benzoquinol methylase